MSKYLDKVYASITFGSYLDTLGFYNGNWEFNLGYNKKISEITIAQHLNFNIIQQYFALGGLNINISNWKSSDDTILMMAIAKGCLKGGTEQNYIKSLTDSLKELEKDEREAGFTTINSLRIIKKTKNINSLNYSDKMGGNGAAIRSAPIGLIHYREKDLDKLIEQSIVSSRVTHNHVYGFLGGLITALFTSYAVRNISPLEWCDKLLELYESNKIDKYFKNTNIHKKYMRDKNLFWNNWYEYREKILDQTKNVADLNLYRHEKLFKLTPGINFSKNKDYSKYGASGIGAVILAYDAIIRSYNHNYGTFNIDSLIIFSSLHFGDNDSTGIIAGSWIGAYNGWEPSINLKYKMKELEFFKELNIIANNIIKLNSKKK